MSNQPKTSFAPDLIVKTLDYDLFTGIYSVYMYDAVINIKTEAETKKRAQKFAKDLGVSLSALINSYLKQIIRTKKVEMSVSEEPSDYLISMMKKAERNYKEGKGSPVFHSGEEAVEWLENS